MMAYPNENFWLHYMNMNNETPTDPKGIET